MESAIFGLVGVVIGGLLNIAKDWWIERQNKAKNAEYLSIQIACALERYAFNCAEVVHDDGACCGQPDKDGWYRPQITPPEFDPMSFDVEWKSLPVELMYEILNFPYKAKLAEEHVSAKFEHDDPPYFQYSFEERQLQYAALGLAAWELAEKLRKHIKIELLPKNVENWTPIADMEWRKSAIDSRRAEKEVCSVEQNPAPLPSG